MDLKNTNSSFIDRTGIINSYLDEIRKYKVLTTEEEKGLFFRIREYNDMAAREKIINSNQRFVFAVAKRYAADDRLMELVEEGNIGMIKAIDSYDYTKDTKFISYAVWYIRREINAYLINEDVLVRKTNNVKTGTRINKIKSKFYCENGRYPTNEELIEIFGENYGIKIQDVSDLLDIKFDSINATFDSDDSCEFENSPLFIEKTASENLYEKEIENDYNTSLSATMMSVLNERERTITEMSFGIGYNKEYTNQEIAEELELSTERVRQLRNEALGKMRKAYKMCQV